MTLPKRMPLCLLGIFGAQKGVSRDNKDVERHLFDGEFGPALARGIVPMCEAMLCRVPGRGLERSHDSGMAAQSTRPPDKNHINALVGRFVYIVLDDSTVSIFQDLTIVI